MFKEGDRCGSLVLVTQTRDVSKHKRWEARCDCGAWVVIRDYNLRRRNTMSCRPCAKVGKPLTNWLNFKTGSYVIKERFVDQNDILWIGVCHCGDEIAKTAKQLRYIKQKKREINCETCHLIVKNLKSPSNPRSRVLKGKKIGNFIDISGVRYGDLVALKVSVKNGRRAWECQCDCGEIIIARAPELRRGLRYCCNTCTKVYRSLRNQNKYQDLKFIYGNLTAFYWNSVIRNAQTRGITFDITPAFAHDLLIAQNFKCALSGESLIFPQRGIDNSASLDRIDSSLGYFPSNVQWVHKKVNWIKGAVPENIFIEWCGKIFRHSQNIS